MYAVSATKNWTPSLTTLAAAERERRRRRRGLDFDAWLPTVSPTYHWRWLHLQHIRAQVARVTRGEIDRLILTVPPRHGKSEMVTVRYPAWVLEQDPSQRVIVGAYNQTLANKFSRKTRNIARQRLTLNDERTAVDDWETGAGGGLRAVGVGAGITGMGGNLIVIDDPVKNRAEANSLAYRDRVWDWYTDDLYTRLEPGGKMILIMCMTGDTPVLMADGAERPLRDIRAGDRVATYDNGRLGTSTVRNHRSNGLDSVFRIKMICGKIVHANERHPFLVQEHGQFKWIRLRNLTTGQRIVTAKDNGGSGKGKLASLMDAKNPLALVATAPRITARRCGQTGIVLQQLTQSTAGMCASSSDMELPAPSTTQCLKRKAESALSVGSRQATMCERIGAESSALTIAMTQTQSEDFCATTATLPWDTLRQKQQRLLFSNTSDFTTTQIESIEPAGVAEVFDVQIEDTENFIANGLVSHNTRWHEDDLAGRLLTSEEADAWHVVNLPALAEADDPLGREPGEALCPERYDEQDLARIKTVMGNSFSALYQQRPTAPDGEFFKRAWFEIVGGAPVDCAWVRYWDKAGTAGDGDYTAGVLMGRKAGIFYIADVVRGQWSAGDRERIIRQTAEMDAQRGSVRIWHEQEPGSGGKDSADATTRNLAGFPVYVERATGDKATRAEPLAAQAQAGNVKIVRGAWNAGYLSELTSFPQGSNDDQVDASSGAFNKLAVFMGALVDFA